MTIRTRAPKAAALLAASALLATTTALPVHLRAADPYDATLEKRVEALERELNLMSGDSKGKNTQTYEVPAFLRAAGKQVQELTIQGELRFRFQWDERTTNVTPGFNNHIQQVRERMRLRLNLNYKFSDNWFAGLGVTTAAAADSNHQTIGEGFDNQSIYLNLYFLGWKINDNITLLGGKILAPFYNNTDTILDFGDVRPVGFTERFNFDITPQLNVKANFGQYFFYDNPENGSTTASGATILAPTRNAAGGLLTPGTRAANGQLIAANGNDSDLKTDAIFLYQDLILTYKPSNKFSVIAAPGFYTFVGGGSGVTGGAPGAVRNQNASTNDSSLTGTLLNSAPFNDANSSRNLYVGLFGTEVNFPVGPINNVKIFGDVAYNFTGGARAVDVYNIREDKAIDKITWVAGILIGELKKKGDFYVSANWASVGIGSIDPNLNDPNYAQSRLNSQGFRLAAGYNFYSWLKGEIIYYNNWNLEKNLHRANDGSRLNVAKGTGVLPNGAVDYRTFTNFTTEPFADLNSSQVVQVQLTANF